MSLDGQDMRKPYPMDIRQILYFGRRNSCIGGSENTWPLSKRIMIALVSCCHRPGCAGRVLRCSDPEAFDFCHFQWGLIYVSLS
jgi:hypothetical protein